MLHTFKWLLGKIPVFVSLTLLALAVVIKGGQYEFIVLLQHKVFDAYQQKFPREYQPAGVKIVDIDDASLARLGQWPWPRQTIARLVDRLVELGAGPIAFDVVFAEPDRTSPKHISQLWHADEQLKGLLNKLPDHDDILAKSYENGYIVSGFVLNHNNTPRMPQHKYGMSYVGMPGAHPKDHLRENYTGATLNLKPLEDASEGIGFFNNIPDSDGIIRRIPLTLMGDDELYFSLSMEALRVAQGASSYIIKMAGASGEESYGTDTGITHIRNGHFEIPTDAEGRMLVHYTPYVQERYIPAWKILEDDFDASQIEGNVLFIGTSAPGLLDLRATPLNPSLPGVEVHVQALEQILLGQFLYRPDLMLGAEVLVMIVGGLLLMLVMARLTAIWGAIFMVFAQGLCFASSVYAFTEYGWMVEPVSPSLVILMLYISESLRRYMLSESERKQVRSAFSQYMSPALVEELAKDPKKLALGGEMRVMSVLFCDVRGFTTISERFNAEQLTTFINNFLTPMTDVILKRKGTIDKYMGDCIMAFWNAPLEDRKHPYNTCMSALEMFEVMNQWNDDRRRRSDEEGWEFFPVNIGAGANTGEICVGNMGSDQRFDYSVLGDDVNLASRLEGQSKTYGVGVVIGAATQAEVPDLATIELDRIQVKGKTTGVTIYALYGDEWLAQNDAFIKCKALWNKVLKAYRDQQWDEAENFMRLSESAAAKVWMTKTPVEEFPDGAKQRRANISTSRGGFLDLSVLMELYRERIRLYRVTPPPADWDGVFIATSK